MDKKDIRTTAVFLALLAVLTVGSKLNKNEKNKEQNEITIEETKEQLASEGASYQINRDSKGNIIGVYKREITNYTIPATLMTDEEGNTYYTVPRGYVLKGNQGFKTEYRYTAVPLEECEELLSAIKEKLTHDFGVKYDLDRIDDENIKIEEEIKYPAFITIENGKINYSLPNGGVLKGDAGYLNNLYIARRIENQIYIHRVVVIKEENEYKYGYSMVNEEKYNELYPLVKDKLILTKNL